LNISLNQYKTTKHRILGNLFMTRGLLLKWRLQEIADMRKEIHLDYL
jgi:hypothetical protein